MRRSWQILLMVYWLALFVGTHLPPSVPGLPGDRLDKLAHVVAFAGLSCLAAITWEVSAGRLTIRHYQWLWLALAIYGAFDETTQPAVGRIGSWPDWLADIVGVAVGIAVFHRLRWLLPSHVGSSTDGSSTGECPRGRFRFSLRALFIAVTLLAVIWYWLMLPTIHARQFASILAAKDYTAAKAMFAEGKYGYLFDYMKYEETILSVRILPLAWRDVWNLERRVSVDVDYRNQVTPSYYRFIVLSRWNHLEVEIAYAREVKRSGSGGQ